MARGIFVGGPEESSFCAWNRLDSLTEDAKSTIATVSHLNLFHVEVLACDTAFASTFQHPLLESILLCAEHLKSVPAGMQFVRKNIALGPQKND